MSAVCLNKDQNKNLEKTAGIKLMGDFNHPDIYWKDNRTVYKQSRRFEGIYDNFLTQVIEALTREGALLYLILRN